MKNNFPNFKAIYDFIQKLAIIAGIVLIVYMIFISDSAIFNAIQNLL